jgi:glycosyltransferase involved in cell wall biosynthesis
VIANRKLVFINRFFYPDHSATSQLLTDLAFTLAKDNLGGVFIITSRQKYDSPNAGLKPMEIVHGVTIVRVWTSRFGRGSIFGRAVDYLTFYFSAIISMFKIVGKNDIVVAKTDPPMISAAAWIVTTIKRARLVNWLQDLFPEVAMALNVPFVTGFPYRILKIIRNKSLASATTNVTIGEQMARRVKSEVPNASVRIIHNWQNGTAIKPIALEECTLRERWKLVDSFVVGYSGNLGRGHDYNTIADAAELMINDDDTRFLFVGGGAKLATLKNHVAARKLPNFVFHNYQPTEKLAECLAVPDIHLISLKPELEGLMVPSKLYGILAAGRCVIFIGDVHGEIANLLEQYNFGFSVEESNSRQLAEKIRLLRDTPKLRTQLNVNARKLFDDHLNRRSALDNWRFLIAEIDNLNP